MSVLSHLDYKPWFALAEYVDNSIQSYADNRDLVTTHDAKESALKVSIELDFGSSSIVITDNAAGISLDDFPRAFRPAELPPNRAGLCEFGMGMKSASCWFSPRWRVRTSVPGEPVEREIAFDVNEIVMDEVAELEIRERPVDRNAHYTVVELTDVRNMPVGRTSGKIKEHLTDIYREFLRNGDLILRYRGDELEYEEPKILNASLFNTNHEAVGEKIEWRKEIDFDFGGGLEVKGFAALRHQNSTKYAGLSLFRRGRVIQGSGDEKYRPELIFGSSNTFAYQMLFGELYLKGFDVSHTKAGFRWDENEQPFLELLKDHLDSEELPLLRQARNFRKRTSKSTLRRVAEAVVKSTGDALKQHLPNEVERARESALPPREPATSLAKAELAGRREIDIDFNDERWRIVLELCSDPSIRDWYSLAESVIADVDKGNRMLLGVRMALDHPFMAKFVRMDHEHIEPFARLAAAMGLAEKVARDAGGDYPTAVRMNLNELLRGALAQKSESEEL
ncbi:ATP-binding protein [Candidatus Bipolaricaulota bacterium]